MPIDISAKGLQETKQNMLNAAAELHGAPMISGMRRATLIVERPAKKNAPVFQGRLRASINSEVRVEGVGTPNVIGVVGTPVKYAAAVELGSKPHWVPPGVLDRWAKAHGINPYLVARAIAKHGTKPRYFLKNAFESSKAQVVIILGESVSGIVKKANNNG